jgi:hypothetical protein
MLAEANLACCAVFDAAQSNRSGPRFSELHEKAAKYRLTTFTKNGVARNFHKIKVQAELFRLTLNIKSPNLV